MMDSLDKLVRADHGGDDFKTAVLEGLSVPQKSVPPRFFYDFRGSELFEQITQLDAYYVTRTEIGILSRPDFNLGAYVPEGAVVVEYGAGSARKTPLILSALKTPSAYVPIDISGEFLAESIVPIGEQFPELNITPVTADFMAPLSLPLGHATRLGLFPGSTLGNLSRAEAIGFMTRARKTLGAGAYFLLGLDLVKPISRLLRAYNDENGVTAAFNLNLLRRINHELDGNFNPDHFIHKAIWNPQKSRIEMHLVSLMAQTVTISGRDFDFAADETIHTENSHKYDPAMIDNLLEASGWAMVTSWVDHDTPYGLFLLRPL
jgi:dimethylhistidine N-methyltransferase